MTDTTALLIGETTFPFHSIDEKGPELAAAIGDAADVTTTTDRDALCDLSEYDVLIDYLTDSELTEDQLEGVLSFVRDGGGYLPLHCGADLISTAAADPDELLDQREEPVPELRAVIGGHFLTHPEESEFGVDILEDHPVTDGVEDFQIFDEPYQLDVDDGDDSDLTILARMDHPDLEDYPIAWTRTEGDGRVCYISLGHTDEALQNESFRTLLRNAIAWTA
ncbi:ThuA domain-containing protein [Natronolimnobius baerhuensis]|uniref:Glycosyl hydrolase n=1 Tax=Natronolimnobius baerhuensis TaxID=253108 RepID=A0A202E724_9EURY|nr:ThuA domain-containing protein [Natronolimnobius baerhuensis]OVE83994.1 glycosyl hydrolase [Natronolimnobius baerhuensis]